MAAMGHRIEKVGGGFFVSWKVPSKGAFSEPSCECQAVVVESISCCWGGCGLPLDPMRASSSAGAGNRTLSVCSQTCCQTLALSLCPLVC